MKNTDGEKNTRWENLIKAVRGFAEELEYIVEDF